MKLRFPLSQVFRRAVCRVVAPLFLLLAFAPAGFAQGVTIRFAGDSDVGEGGRWFRAAAEEWAKSTGNKLEYISRPNDASECLQQFQQYWAAKSPDIDVYMIDVIWPGIAAPHAVDLKKYLKEDEIKAHFPRIIENNTVGGQLVGLPSHSDAGLLYYRTDLLEKYGFKGPPATWEELTTQAKTIQDGERKAGQRDFQGFVFEGKASESVTCNAVEWIFSYGGGTVIDPDKKITINNPQAIKALATAKSWVGTISPKGVTIYGEEEARNTWQGGHAAFMRNWPYAYALGADPKSAISGKFDITVLPKGGENGKNAATLGGWQIMVSKYSKHPEVAADLVRSLCSPQAQKRRALELTYIPTLPALYSDPDILAKNPWFKNVLPVLENAVARPSTVTGANYNQVSTAIFQNVNTMLSGGSTPEKAVQQIERTARRVVK
ncbi:MAG TPA: ABC transporter substrate-binding protein [Chthoniobacterales bacterium]